MLAQATTPATSNFDAARISIMKLCLRQQAVAGSRQDDLDFRL